MSHKFGRRARIHDERVPKWAAHFSRMPKAALPSAVDYSGVLPTTGLGMFGNDVLGDCTCAAVYHGIQTWTANANPPMDQEPDTNAVLLYSDACGYVQGNPATDQGGIIQNVLGYWLNTGVPVGPGGASRQQLDAFVEIDQNLLDDVKQAIYQGGGIDIGFNVPAFFNTSAPVWDVDPNGDNTIVDGHSVWVTGYNDLTQRFKLISWGQLFEMSYAFFLQFCDEAYMLANKLWFAKTGLDPTGQIMAQLEAAMQPLKWQGATHFHRWHIKRRRRLWRNAGMTPGPNGWVHA